MTIRTIWLKAHLYVGLTIGLVLFIVALSGAALVFEDNIDRSLPPTLAYVAPLRATMNSTRPMVSPT